MSQLLTAGRPSDNYNKALRQVRKDLEPQARLSVVVPKKYHKQLKKIAVENNMTVTDLVIGAINDKINKLTN